MLRISSIADTSWNRFALILSSAVCCLLSIVCSLLSVMEGCPRAREFLWSIRLWMVAVRIQWTIVWRNCHIFEHLIWLRRIWFSRLSRRMVGDLFSAGSVLLFEHLPFDIYGLVSWWPRGNWMMILLRGIIWQVGELWQAHYPGRFERIWPSVKGHYWTVSEVSLTKSSFLGD
jgi:hypothetical protein